VEKLTEKQAKFVEFYIQTGNGTKSAIMAGYSEKTAGSISSENLQKPIILKAIEQRREELRKNIQNQFLNDAKVAREVMYQVMQDEYTSARDKITAAKDFLDRAGFKPVDKHEIEMDIETEINVNLIGFDPGEQEEE
jgi:phage terminase small subunit